MDEPLRLAFAIVSLICGWALAIYAGYLHYVALPGEQAGRPRVTRAAFAVVGVSLIVLAAWLLR